MKIPYDKKLHVTAGIIISIIGTFIFNHVYGFIGAMLAGIVKELYDFCDYGKFDSNDMLATWAGGLLGTLIIMTVRWISWTY